MNADTALNFTDSEFDREVLESDLPVLVDFYGVECRPCQIIAPIVDQLAAEYTGRIRVGKLNAHEHASTAARFQINSVPTLILFDGGEEQRRVVGLQSQKALRELLDTCCQSA